MDPKKLSINEFHYHLPEERIATYPLAERDASKLLIYRNGTIKDDIYRNLATYLQPETLLVFNDTKVIEARLLFQKQTGGVIEIFCLDPSDQYPDIATALAQQKKVTWHCLVGGASKWKHGTILEKKINNGHNEIILHVAYAGKTKDAFILEFTWDDDATNFAEILHHAGAVPLPPYIKRATERSDAERYQTVFAQHEGSVAAPTAGLHFTEKQLGELKASNIHFDFVTLHVGAGTFKPVKSQIMEEHEMHAELISVSKKTIENIIRHIHGTIIPVGTTSLRTIESLYWIGVKLISDNNDPELKQWEPYEIEKTNIPPTQSLEAILAFMDKNNMEYLVTKTRIMIAPSYKLKIAKGLITNFHQPQSTLILLVAALIGDDWRKVYNHALQNNYRFLSYGDGCYFDLSATIPAQEQER